MSNYRRARTAGGTYFFTAVTEGRRQWLTTPESRAALREVIHAVRHQYPFTIDAWVLLPDHIHCLWTLPADDADFSKRWGLIKAGFSKRMKNCPPLYDVTSPSRKRHRESSIWQRRFWERQVRDEDDFRRHMDYIHFNPVKHGLVTRVTDWPYSTFHRHVANGMYPESWGGGNASALNGGFGE
jgi:putative transposase